VAEAAFQSVDVGEDAIQSSAALDASCHTSLARATSVHISAVPPSGSHFSIAFAAKDDCACICAAENVVRVLVAETDALAATAPMPTKVAVVLADVDRIG
jgi:hypothetical protein